MGAYVLTCVRAGGQEHARVCPNPNPNLTVCLCKLPVALPQGCFFMQPVLACGSSLLACPGIFQCRSGVCTIVIRL